MSPATPDLFDCLPPEPGPTQLIAPGACLLPGRALGMAEDFCRVLARIEQTAPLRHMNTPGGLRMSVAMSNCGQAGWVSDAQGYRYSRHDPTTGQPWPPMPEPWAALARQAAAQAGFPGFAPDSCLINRYQPGTRLTLHQDRNEADLQAPIVSVSLGLPAVFLFGGLQRSQRPQRIGLRHGDVLVWGGPSRLVYHGVLPLADGHHTLLGAQRINLTFRKAF